MSSSSCQMMTPAENHEVIHETEERGGVHDVRLSEVHSAGTKSHAGKVGTPMSLVGSLHRRAIEKVVRLAVRPREKTMSNEEEEAKLIRKLKDCFEVLGKAKELRKELKGPTKLGKEGLSDDDEKTFASQLSNVNNAIEKLDEKRFKLLGQIADQDNTKKGGKVKQKKLSR